MAKYSRSKRKEKREVGVLEDILNTNPLLTQLTRGDDDFPLIDGYAHLLGAEEVGGNMLTFASDAKEVFTERGQHARKVFLSALGLNLLLKDKKIGIDTDIALLPMILVSNSAAQKI